MPKPRFAVLRLDVMSDGTIAPVESFERVHEKACYKYARFLLASFPQCLCELHTSVDDGATWTKVRDIERDFLPGDAIHAMHVRPGMFLTDSVQLFEVLPADHPQVQTELPGRKEAVLRVYKTLPTPNPRKSEPRIPGTLVLHHFTLDFVYVGVQARADAVFEDMLRRKQAIDAQRKQSARIAGRNGLVAASLGLLPVEIGMPTAAEDVAKSSR